jgi:hypothetical protein
MGLETAEGRKGKAGVLKMSKAEGENTEDAFHVRTVRSTHRCHTRYVTCR